MMLLSASSKFCVCLLVAPFSLKDLLAIEDEDVLVRLLEVLLQTSRENTQASWSISPLSCKES